MAPGWDLSCNLKITCPILYHQTIHTYTCFCCCYRVDVAMMAAWNSSIRQVICFDTCRHMKVSTILDIAYPIFLICINNLSLKELGNMSWMCEIWSQKGQGHMGFFVVFQCAWCCGYPRTVLSLEEGLMILLYTFFISVIIWSDVNVHLLQLLLCVYFMVFLSCFRLCLWNWWLLSEIWKLGFATKAQGSCSQKGLALPFFAVQNYVWRVRILALACCSACGHFWQIQLWQNS